MGSMRGFAGLGRGPEGRRQPQGLGWGWRSWDPQRKTWNLSYERVVPLGLQERVIGRWEGWS